MRLPLDVAVIGTALPHSTRVLVLVAHPDDETIGAGGLLCRLLMMGATVAVAHVTNGAPPDGHDARAAGFAIPATYARARRLELSSALSQLPGAVRCFSFDVDDQHASWCMTGLVRAVSSLITICAPNILLTHAYEGGHPDHDATAFVAREAVTHINAAGRQAPALWELSCYFWTGGRLRTGDFLPAGGDRIGYVVLDAHEQRTKQQMLACFHTQSHMLGQFKIGPEPFRPAPLYDFGRPPHPGRLFYEHFDWGIDPVTWRRNAAAATQQMHTPSAT